MRPEVDKFNKDGFANSAKLCTRRLGVLQVADEIIFDVTRLQIGMGLSTMFFL